jgi:hypothetical protein
VATRTAADPRAAASVERFAPFILEPRFLAPVLGATSCWT